MESGSVYPKSQVKGIYKINDVKVMIGFGKAQLLIFTVGSFYIIYCICEIMGMAIISPSSNCDLNIQNAEQAELMTSTFKGLILSSYYIGFLSDKYGRRTILIYSTLLTFTFSLLSTLMPNYYSYHFMRVLTGIFLAGPIIVTLPYVAEFMLDQYRTKVMNYLYMFNGVGMIYMPGTAQILINMNWKINLIIITYRPWRLLGFIYILPGIIALVLLYHLPESPKYLLAADKHDEAFKVVNWISLRNNGVPLESLGVVGFEPLLSRDNNANRIWICELWLDLLPIFAKAYVKQFLLSCATMMGLVAVASGLGLWYTDVRNRLRISNEISEDNEITLCERISEFESANITLRFDSRPQPCFEYIKQFWDSITMGICFIAGYNIIGLLLLITNRKRIFIYSLIISGICGLCINFVTLQVLELIFLILFLVLPAILVNFLNTFVMDNTPTYLRNKALSIVTILGRVGAILGCHIGIYFLNNVCFLVFTLLPLISFCK
ncbi:putative transporter SVOPL [Teleopsis dalmanni]|uniref:putative transporter SVOPL n=1 Tax=Teleopsis dalmanni TaxID=139649 RepID=UPI0018CECC47|nr:putative transporter SVOPL [Teleopsis dalmanni]